MAVSKAAKAALKEAALALRGGDPDGALRALEGAQAGAVAEQAGTLRGKALFLRGDLAGAAAAYRGVAELNPAGLPAWQGLAEVYGAQGDTEQGAAALLRVLELLRAADPPDLKKLFDYAGRLAGVTGADAPPGGLIEAFSAVARGSAPGSGPHVQSLVELLARLPVAEFEAAAGLPELAALRAVCGADAAFEERGRMQERLGKRLEEELLRTKVGEAGRDAVLGELRALLSGALAQPGGSEWMHLAYRRTLLEGATCSPSGRALVEGADLDRISEAIAAEFAGTSVGLVCKAHLALSAADPTEAAVAAAKEAVQRSLKLDKSSYEGWWLLSTVFSRDNQTQALQCVLQSMRQVSLAAKAGFNVAGLLPGMRLRKATLLEQQGRLEDAGAEYDVLLKGADLPPAARSRVYLGKANILKLQGDAEGRLGAVEKAVEADGSNWEASADYAYLSARGDGPLEGVETLLALEADLTDKGLPAAAAHVAYLVGRLYWKGGGDHRARKEYFVGKMMGAAAVKFAEQDRAFKWLGHNYLRVKRDPARAVKCYKKALEINPRCAGAGRAVCAILTEDGRVDELAQLCERILGASPNATWATMPCAYQSVRLGDFEKAVTLLQQHLRKEIRDVDAWEALGMAYKGLGRKTSAVKAFQRALELDGSRLLPVVQLGHLFLDLQDAKQAIEATRGAAASHPEFPPLQVAFCKALLAHAHNCFGQMLVPEAQGHAAEAEAVLRGIRGAAGAVDLVEKLKGDAAMLLCRLPRPKAAPAERAAVGTAKAGEARRAYCKALHARPFCAGGWADVGFAAYWEQLFAAAEGGDLPERMLTAALKLDPADAEVWAAWGVVASDNRVREFCLSKALQLDGTAADVWVALGYLYLLTGHAGLADECFTEARMQDSISAGAWRGGGLVRLENFGLDPSTTALFEHAGSLQLTDLDSQLLSVAGALGQGDPASAGTFNAAYRATLLRPSAASHNMFGLVQHAMGMHAGATASFAAALAAIEGEGTAARVSLAGLDPAGAADARALSAEDASSVVFCNLARTAAAQGDFGGALGWIAKAEAASPAHVSGRTEVLRIACEWRTAQRGDCLPRVEALFGALADPATLKEANDLRREILIDTGAFGTVIHELGDLMRSDDPAVAGIMAAVVGSAGAAGGPALAAVLRDLRAKHAEVGRPWPAATVAAGYLAQARAVAGRGGRGGAAARLAAKAVHAWPTDGPARAELAMHLDSGGAVQDSAASLRGSGALALLRARQRRSGAASDAASEQKLKGAVAHWLHRDPTAGQWWEESRAFVS